MIPGTVDNVRSADAPRFVVVDFFCGAGGTTSGLISAGCYVLAGVDKDSECAETYVENNVNGTWDRAKVRYLNMDIFKPSMSHPGGQQGRLFDELGPMIERARAELPGVPLLFAICAPCQPFTSLSRSPLSDERADARMRDRSLLLETLKFVDEFRPEAVLSENVAGIDAPKYGDVWKTFRKELRKRGYAVGDEEVMASRFGVPQKRVRRILAGVKGVPSGALKLPDSDGTGEIPNVMQRIGGLPPIRAGECHPSDRNHRASKLTEINLLRISKAKPGGKNQYLDEDDLSLPCHRRARESGQKSSFSHVYTRLAGDQPAPTLTTKFTSISNGQYGHYDVAQNRGLSVREGALIQSFPPDYIFYHDSLIVQARMVGNAVPPKLAEFFGGWIADVYEGTIDAGIHSADADTDQLSLV